MVRRARAEGTIGGGRTAMPCRPTPEIDGERASVDAGRDAQASAAFAGGGGRIESRSVASSLDTVQ